jgi:hypothetical protein
MSIGIDWKEDMILRILVQESPDSELRLKDMKERSSEGEIGILERIRGIFGNT